MGKTKRKSSSVGQVLEGAGGAYERKKMTIIEQLSIGLQKWVSGEDLQDALLGANLERLEMFP